MAALARQRCDVGAGRRGRLRLRHHVQRHQGGFLGTAPLAAGGHVLLGTLEGKVLRLDPASGKSVATYPVGSPIRSQPVVADGWIYIGTEDGRLVAIDTKDASIPAGRPGAATRNAVESRVERHSPDSR